jgi:hypothetical protein
MSAVTDRTRSTIEIGAVMAGFVFLVTLAFNAGIQYGQIHNLQVNVDAHDVQIRAMQASNAAASAQIGQSLAHIETLVEDMRASQELRATGAGH